MDFNFIQLRKLKVSNQLNPCDYINNLAISARNKILFVATKNAFKAIYISTILDFEWTKNIVDQTIEDYPCFSFELDFEPYILSVSGGSNNILVLAGTKGSNTIIDFFDINDILKNDFKPFNRISLFNSGQVLSLDWHPEYCESLIALVSSDGSLLSIGIDLLSKGVCILSRFIESNKITCSSWSPKGKQLVVGCQDGYLIQYKHTNGKSFFKAKCISPIENLCLPIINVKWVHTSLFQAVYADTPPKVVFICAPSKALPEYYDFGNVCLESLSGPYWFNLCPMGNILLCTSSRSSEVSVIGCSTKELNPLPTAWNQWILEDKGRIELECDQATESTTCGIDWFEGPCKEFQAGDQIIKGTLVCVLSSSGMLCPYYAFERNGNLALVKRSGPSQTLNISLPAPTHVITYKTCKQQTQQDNEVNENIQAKQLSQKQSPLQSPQNPQQAQVQQPAKPQPKQQTQQQIRAIASQQKIQAQTQALQTLEQQKRHLQTPRQASQTTEESNKDKLDEQSRIKNQACAQAICEIILEMNANIENLKNSMDIVKRLNISKHLDETNQLVKELNRFGEMCVLSKKSLRDLDMGRINGTLLECMVGIEMCLNGTGSLRRGWGEKRMNEIRKLRDWLEERIKDVIDEVDEMHREGISKNPSSLLMVTQTLTTHYKKILLLKDRLDQLESCVKLDDEIAVKMDMKMSNKYNKNKTTDIIKLARSLEQTYITRNASNEQIRHFPLDTMKEALLEYFENRRPKVIREVDEKDVDGLAKRIQEKLLTKAIKQTSPETSSQIDNSLLQNFNMEQSKVTSFTSNNDSKTSPNTFLSLGISDTNNQQTILDHTLTSFAKETKILSKANLNSQTISISGSTKSVPNVSVSNSNLSKSTYLGYNSVKPSNQHQTFVVTSTSMLTPSVSSSHKVSPHPPSTVFKFTISPNLSSKTSETTVLQKGQISPNTYTAVKLSSLQPLNVKGFVSDLSPILNSDKSNLSSKQIPKPIYEDISPPLTPKLEESNCGPTCSTMLNETLYSDFKTAIEDAKCEIKDKKTETDKETLKTHNVSTTHSSTSLSLSMQSSIVKGKSGNMTSKTNETNKNVTSSINPISTATSVFSTNLNTTVKKELFKDSLDLALQTNTSTPSSLSTKGLTYTSEVQTSPTNISTTTVSSLSSLPKEPVTSGVSTTSDESFKTTSQENVASTVVSTTQSPETSNQSTGLFGMGNQESSFNFNASLKSLGSKVPNDPPKNPFSSTSTSSPQLQLFGNKLSTPFGSKYTSPFSMNSQTSTSSVFPATQTSATTFPFALSQTIQSTSLFSESNQNSLVFGSPTSTSSFPFGNTFITESPVAATGFGGFAAQANRPTFGSSPTFGASPSFGAAPSFDAPSFFFGGSPGTSTQQSAVRAPFANFASSDSPTFGELAGQSSPFGFASAAQSQNFFGNTSSGFTASPQFQSPQFSHRRQ